MQAEPIRLRLQSGELLIGSWLFLGSPVTAEVMSLAGFDLLILDLEHSAGDVETLYHQLRAISAQSVPVVVRVGDDTAAPIKRALDAGAAGVVLPDVRSAESGRRFVDATRYAPEGSRGTHRLSRAAAYGLNWNGYLAQQAANPLTIGLVESAAGVSALDALLEIDKLDVIFIGAADLAASVGRLAEPQHPDVQDMVREIETKTLKAGKVLGGLAADAEEGRAKAAAGYRLLTFGSDALYLRNTAVEAARAARAALKP
ncbi:HpcH/HpaI aldolase family protein [Pelagibius sp.]|uniref:HpcH/HpaI aldolase family protein n=1 Tax=Pelagibius sp. TaxID=1931238 RepID=UPI003BAF69F0